MNRRFSSIVALALVSSSLAACGSDEPEDKKPTTTKLEGVYRPVDQGPIGSITFSGSQSYLLMPRGCAGGACAEIGTYRLDVASKTLVLENFATHKTRTIALEVVETTPASASLVQSVSPRDLIEPGQQLNRPGGGQLNNGSGNQLNNGSNNELNKGSGNSVTGAVTQLIQTILEAIMNGQQMKRDADDKKAEEAKKDDANPKPDPKINPLDCKQGVPTKDSTPADALAYFARCPGGP